MPYISNIIYGYVLFLSKADCSALKADILFILDSSTSVGPSNFILEKQFMWNFINSLPIGQKATQVGELTFSTPVSSFHLNRYTTKSELVRAISTLSYMYGHTHTEKALHEARTNIFRPWNGDRPDAPNIIIILTDGKSTDRTQTMIEASLLRLTGTRIISVGLGQPDMTELMMLASSPEDVFTVDYFNLPSQQFRNRILNAICVGEHFGYWFTENYWVSLRKIVIPGFRTDLICTSSMLMW